MHDIDPLGPVLPDQRLHLVPVAGTLIGEVKSHLQHLLTAVAINVVRLSEWWAGTPLSRTRCSRFAALQPAA